MLVGSVDGRGEVAERERGRWGGEAAAAMVVVG
jgi:hypothetical protein